MDEEVVSLMLKVADLEGFKIEEVTIEGGFTNKEIELIEKENSLCLPEDYREFIKNFGYWGLGFEVYGLTSRGIRTLESLNKSKSEMGKGLPDGYLVVENADEFMYVLSLETKCVYIWERRYGNMDLEYQNFNDYFKDRLNSIIEDY